MFKTPNVDEKLFAILQEGRWDLIAPFFNTWENEDEMIDKVLLYGHLFLDHYFRDPSPEFHRVIIKRFFSNRNEYTAAPRGFSKTTVLQTCCSFSIVNKLDRFIVIVEKTFTEAAEVIKGVHDEFVDNEKIIMAYGHLIAPRTSKISNPEAKGDVVINGIRLRGKGFNSSIRGLKTREWRPTRIILDDVEEDEHISNPEQRAKYERNYNKGIQPAIDINGTIKMFGTILHQDSLLKNQIDSHGGLIFRAHEGNDPATAPADSFLWPQRWNRETLIKKRNDMMSSGQSSSAYAQEYLNDPISDEDRSFKWDWLWEMVTKPDQPKEQYRVPKARMTMEQFDRIRKKTVLNGYAMIDAADATTEKADFTGAVVQFVAPNGARFRVDCRREKRNIKGLIDLIFEIWTMWAPKGLIKIGIEKKAFHDQVKPLLDEESRRRQVYPVVEELKPMGRSKENRIKGGLQGFYETEKIVSVGRVDERGYFKAVGDTDILLEELHDFPNSKHDDLSDAEAYSADMVIVPLADEGKPLPNREPQNDPFEEARQEPSQYFNNHVGVYDDGDAYD